MKNYIKNSKIVLSSVIALFISACTTYGPGTDYAPQGKIWRGDIVVQYFDVKAKNIESSVRAGFHFDDSRDIGRRYAKVRVLDGAFFKDIIVSPVIVPDAVEYSELTKGAIVDIIMQKGTETDYRAGRINRIVKLVCAGTDQACIKKERSAGRVNTVIDEHPGIDYTGGSTYSRRISEAERKLYD
jgi:hypothetical protein